MSAPGTAPRTGHVRVTSEIGRLRAVICHTPGRELLAVTPTNREQFLYDDIIDLEQAKREHHRFRALRDRSHLSEALRHLSRRQASFGRRR